MCSTVSELKLGFVVEPSTKELTDQVKAICTSTKSAIMMPCGECSSTAELTNVEMAVSFLSPIPDYAILRVQYTTANMYAPLHINLYKKFKFQEFTYGLYLC